MDNTFIAVETLLWVLGIIVVIGSASLVISRWLSPFRKLKADVETHTTLLQRDQVRISDAEGTNRILCHSILALLDHEITGNSIARMTQAKNDLQDHLADR